MTMQQTARDFFDACETGKGWEACRQWCTDDAAFACQADALAEVTTLAGYCDWMTDLLVPLPDGRYELTGFAVDSDHNRAIATAVFHGTHTVDTGDGAPTGKAAASDYAYVMTFTGDKISHMTKIWNDGQALRQLGWA